MQHLIATQARSTLVSETGCHLGAAVKLCIISGRHLGATDPMYHHGSPPTRDPTLCITLGCHLGATLCVIIIKAYHSLAYHGNIIMFLGVFVTLKQPIYWQLSNLP